MTTADETILLPLLQEYVDAVLRRLPPGREPGRIVPIVPGTEPAWDDCCAGQLYGQVLEIAPSGDRSPTPGGIACGVTGWVASLAIGLLRCAHTVDDRGRAPSAEHVYSDGREMLHDMRVIHDALLASRATRSVIGWSPLTVEGGCHGGEWRFTVRLPLYPPIAVAGEEVEP